MGVSVLGLWECRGSGLRALGFRFSYGAPKLKSWSTPIVGFQLPRILDSEFFFFAHQPTPWIPGPEAPPRDAAQVGVESFQ